MSVLSEANAKLCEEAREVQAAKKAAVDLAKKAEEDKLRAKDMLEKTDEKEKALFKKIVDAIKVIEANLEGTYKGVATNRKLLTPQIRVLHAFCPRDRDDHCTDWPTYNRAALNERVGYTEFSGTLCRALNGGHNSTGGERVPGLIDLGMVEEITVDVVGRLEVNYRITSAGICALVENLAERGGSLPPVKDAAKCVNDRYKK